ncbi:MAG: ABC transporter permease [Peptococcaceae bacterium]|jgi:putative ABC transport system permease protein|nr:ABC transporter permease [Peptococcaceae bacterium]
MSLFVVQGTMEQGLMYAIMVLGVYLSFRVLNYADLTVDGSFTLGAATVAALITAGFNPWFATAVAFFNGCLAGTVTGMLHTKFRITPLLSGILTMTALYSINLRIMGKANISLLRTRTVFTDFTSLPFLDKYGVLLLSLLVVFVIGILVYIFLQTEFGLALRATGDNQVMICSLGVNTNLTKNIGLALSNGFIALSGSLVAQNQLFADISMGIGMLVIGLASVIIGEVLIGTSSIGRTIAAVLIGGVIYRFIIAIVLQLGLEATDLKLVTALIVVIALVSPGIKRTINLSVKNE